CILSSGCTPTKCGRAISDNVVILEGAQRLAELGLSLAGSDGGETYGSFDYTSLLYLSDYGVDFGGGRFVFMDPNNNRTVEAHALSTGRAA
ncbi:2-oxoglutarate and iron-dependent oxygenase domain-containing protein 3-like, partial [Myxocyprinus asiaticus]|uniref:2-oxoglutarate and iron-dependent oxygenase domain-containing protein 3-like n=1 Tax=Myxocyprinus asiaticus TaxID=70543 RepID=UPI002222D378